MDPTPAEAQTQKENAEVLKDFSSKCRSLSSSIAKLSGSSRGIPCNKDFHFYFNFEKFKDPIQEIAKNSQSILESIGSSAERLWGKKHMAFPQVDIDDDEAYDWLVNVNDELLERFDASIDEFQKLRNKEEETGVRVMGLVDDDGFQLVNGKKKKVFQKDLLVNNDSNKYSSDNNSGSSSSVKVVTRDSKTMGTPRAKIPFHIPSIPRPQDQYKILVNNANQPFEHVWLQKSEDGSRFIHPLEHHSVMEFVDKNVSNIEPVKPLPVESTSFKLIEEVKDLKELAAKLHAASELAVDLEHNQYRSFQGLTCLMQISTRTEDFIVDTLKLRIHIGPYLREVFKDPTKRKVMHGADRDIIWLQRDFGIYVCNLFDTGQASRVLKLDRNSLEHLLQYFCGVAANKEYQNADWRLRPLTNEMLRYAREDTHYLLYIYDLMKRRLLSSSTDPGCPEALLVDVYQRSYDICKQLYQKEVLTECSYLNIYGLAAADLTAQQLSIVAALCEWRDVLARAEDESTGYILPNKVLIEIAKQMPVTPSKLRRMLKARHPYIERNLGSVVSIIRHSMLNGAAFEAAAKKLKEERLEMEAARIAKNTNGEEELPDEEASGNCSNAKADDSIQFENEVGSFIAAINRNNSVARSSEHVISDGNVISRLGETSMNFSHPASRVSIQVQKKPSRAFGALLGNAAGKRKFDLATKATEEIKVEQIKSSVNLPFHSFIEKTEPLIKESAKAQETSTREEPSNVLPATTSSKPNDDDIILLDSDTDSDRGDENVGSASGSRAADNEKEEDVNQLILLDSDSDPSQANQGEERDEEEEPMSLSDLSNSFQKCLQTTNEMRKSKKNDKGDEFSEGLLKVKPFDYAAASKEFFEEAGSDEEGGTKGKPGKADRKKASGSGKKSAAAERSGDFQPGKRRQAFPATGNRSATFR